MKNKNNFTNKLISKKLQLKNDFEVENNFYYKTHKTRLQKVFNHYELIKKIVKVKGDIVELGVFKGISLIRIAQIRDILKLKKKIYGFDTFKEFPSSKNSHEYERQFPKYFKKIVGKPIAKKKLEVILKKKQLNNIKLIEGDIFKSLNIFKKKKNKNIYATFRFGS